MASSSSQSGRSRYDEDERPHAVVRSRTSSVSSLSSASNNRGGGSLRTGRRGMNAHYDRMFGGFTLVRSLGKRKGSTEAELGLGTKRLKVEAGIEPIPGRRAASRAHQADDPKDELDGRLGRDGQDVYLGTEAEQQSSSRPSSPKALATPPSWLQSTLSHLPHNNPLYHPDKGDQLADVKPVRRSRTEGSYPDRADESDSAPQQSSQPSAMSGRQYFDSLSNKRNHSWGGELPSSVDEGARSLAYTSPTRPARLTPPANDHLALGPAHSQLVYDRPVPFDASWQYRAPHQQQLVPFDPRASGPPYGGLDPRLSFGYPAPTAYPAYHPGALYPVSSISPSQPFFPGLFQPPQPFLSNPRRAFPTASHQSLDFPALSAPLPLVHRPSESVLHSQNQLLDPELVRTQARAGGVPFSRPGPGRRDMLEGYNTELMDLEDDQRMIQQQQDAEDAKRRDWSNSSEDDRAATFARPDLRAGRARGPVRYPSGQSGQQRVRSAPWAASQVPIHQIPFASNPLTNKAGERPISKIPPIPTALGIGHRQSTQHQHLPQQRQQPGFDGRPPTTTVHPAPMATIFPISHERSSAEREEEHLPYNEAGPSHIPPARLSSLTVATIPDTPESPPLAEPTQNVIEVVAGQHSTSEDYIPRPRTPDPAAEDGTPYTSETDSPPQVVVRLDPRSGSSKEGGSRYEDAPSERNHTPSDKVASGKPSTPSTPFQPSAKQVATASVSNSFPPNLPKKTPQMLKPEHTSEGSAGVDQRRGGDDEDNVSSRPFQQQDLAHTPTRRTNPYPSPPRPAPALEAARLSSDRVGSSPASNPRVTVRKPQPFPIHFAPRPVVQTPVPTPPSPKIIPPRARTPTIFSDTIRPAMDELGADDPDPGPELQLQSEPEPEPESQRGGTTEEVPQNDRPADAPSPVRSPAASPSQPSEEAQQQQQHGQQQPEPQPAADPQPRTEHEQPAHIQPQPKRPAKRSRSSRPAEPKTKKAPTRRTRSTADSFVEPPPVTTTTSTTRRKRRNSSASLIPTSNFPAEEHTSPEPGPSTKKARKTPAPKAKKPAAKMTTQGRGKKKPRSTPTSEEDDAGDEIIEDNDGTPTQPILPTPAPTLLAASAPVARGRRRGQTPALGPTLAPSPTQSDSEESIHSDFEPSTSSAAIRPKSSAKAHTPITTIRHKVDTDADFDAGGSGWITNTGEKASSPSEWFRFADEDADDGDGFGVSMGGGSGKSGSSMATSDFWGKGAGQGPGFTVFEDK